MIARLRHRPWSLFTALMLATAVAAIGGCTPQGPEWVSDGNVYDRAQARALLDAVEVGDLADRPVSEARTLRQDRLVGLRAKGGDAAAAADLITRTFPVDTAAVPLYVERCTVDGTDALVVIEAWGPPSGTLDLERIWVLDNADGRVLDSAAVN